MKLDPSVARRLAFIKHVYSVGVEQSKAPEYISAVALLSFHDAVELFLQLGSEYLDSGSQQPSFMEYWERIGRKLPEGQELGQKESMRRLNKARVGLKHHGTFPARLEIESFRAVTTSFFEENTPLIFGIEFNEISMIDYVEPEEARDKLKEAERHLGDNDLAAALSAAGMALALMLQDYETRKRDRFGRSPFFFGRDLTFQSSFFMGLDRVAHRGLAEFVDRVKESIEAMQEALKIMALGIDYRRYSRFKLLTPAIRFAIDGTPHSFSRRDVPLLEASDVRFCIDFVVEAALKLSEFDYNLPSTQ